MKNKFLKIGAAFLIAGTMLVSCKKDNASAVSLSQAQLSFGVQTDNTFTPLGTSVNSNGAVVTGGPQAGGSVSLTSGIANISGFKFEAKRKGIEIEIRSRELTTIDLLAPVPPVISTAIDTGTYSEIEIRVEFTRSNTTSLPLVLKGNYTSSSGTVTPFEFDLNDNVEIKAEANNVHVSGTKNLSTIVMLHLNKLFTNVTAADVSNLTLTNGTIIISGSSNTNVYNKILSGLSSCGESKGFEEHDRDK